MIAPGTGHRFGPLLASLAARLRAAVPALAGGAPLRLALAVFAAGLLATGVAVERTWNSGRAEQRAHFEASAERLEGSVGRRVNRAEQLLRNAAAADAAAAGMDRIAFIIYVRSLVGAGELQPAPALGWIERVRRDDLPAFVARQHATGAPDFRVQGDGGAPQLLLVSFLEPGLPGHPALGLDLAADPARRAAIERAVDTGDMTWTAPVNLLGADRIGWIALLPVYRSGMPSGTPQERRHALRGLLFMPLAAVDVLHSVRGVQEDGLQFQVDDETQGQRQAVYDSRTGLPGAAPPQGGLGLHQDRLLVGGRQLVVRTWSDRPVHIDPAVPATGLAGLALSLLLASAAANLLRAREQAEARSRDMQQTLRRMEDLAEHSSGVLLGLDSRLRVRWVNAGFLHLTGWDEAHCRGVPVQRLLRPADGGIELSQAADRLRFGAPRVRGDLIAARRDGGICWLDADLHPEGDGYLLAAIDMTARREAERRLADNEHLLRLMMDSVEARLSYWDADLRCRLANRRVAQAIGLHGSQMIGMALPDVLGPEYWTQLRPRAARALAGEAQRFEWTARMPDGSEQVSLLHYLPDIHHGHVRGVFAFALNITELKEAQRAALRANDAKSQFLSHMSHEIRTPINGILGMLALLRGTELQARQSEYACKAETAARSLLGLLNHVLDLTKIEAGKMLLDAAPFRPAVLLRDVAAILDGAARPRTVRLAFPLDAAIPPVLVGDDMRLRQVLVNLGGNAVKFTREGEVEVSIRLLAREASQVRLEFAVSDTGIGIAAADQERIFNDFSQASAATTREFGGTGLGLGICRRLVAMMGSELRLESAPGQGSRFHFELLLPVGDDDAVPVTPVAPPLAAGQALAGLRVLVVEDNPVNQQVARELLAGQGAQVTLADDGAQGVECVETAVPPFDAVLMDIKMPVMDGWTAAREIRRRLGIVDLPIIAMTANATAADRERSADAGMDHHVAKPFDLPALVALLRQVTGRSAAADEGTAPSAAAPAAESAWSRTTALQRLGGQQALLDRMLPIFRANLRSTAEHLDSLRGDTPPQQAMDLFHKLKGMAATMGADVLAQTAAHAESEVKAGRQDAAAVASQVREALAGTLDALDGA